MSLSSDKRILLDDGMQIPRGTGIGKYSEHLAKALTGVCGAHVDFIAYGSAGAGRSSRRLSYLRYLNSADFRRRAEAYDLCIFTNYAMPFRKLHTKTAVTIHDLAVFDCPRTLPKPYLPYGRMMIANSVRKADAVITVSETMCRAIALRYPFTLNKLDFAWPGVYDHAAANSTSDDYESSLLSEATAHPFFLMVGTVERRKNVELVIRAFSKFIQRADENREYRLILAGRPGLGYDMIRETTSLNNVADCVVFAGYVSDHDCGKLYRDSKALVFPSIYEGFGSIQLECMSMRVPIILSDIPTNREVSEGYGTFFKLGDIDSLVSAMAHVTRVSEEQTAVADEVLRRASWARVAECYATVTETDGR